MTDAELVVEASRHIEQFLREHLKAKGRGLGNSAWDVRAKLAPTLFTGIIYLARIRNKFMHQENFPVDIGTPKYPQLETREQFEALYADIARRLPRLPRPSISTIGETQALSGENNYEAPLPNKITLRAFNGRYITAELHGNCELVANRSETAAWEIFEVSELPDGKVALRAANGMFVSAKFHEHNELKADRPEIDGWESFTVSRFPDGNIALQAFNGLYVSAKIDEDNQLVADRPVADGWESFTVTSAVSQ